MSLRPNVKRGPDINDDSIPTEENREYPTNFEYDVQKSNKSGTTKKRNANKTTKKNMDSTENVPSFADYVSSDSLSSVEGSENTVTPKSKKIIQIKFNLTQEDRDDVKTSAALLEYDITKEGTFYECKHLDTFLLCLRNEASNTANNDISFFLQTEVDSLIQRISLGVTLEDAFTSVILNGDVMAHIILGGENMGNQMEQKSALNIAAQRIVMPIFSTKQMADNNSLVISVGNVSGHHGTVAMAQN